MLKRFTADNMSGLEVRYEIEDAVTLVPVRDVEASIKFYVDMLDFECRFLSDDKNFGTVVHGEAALHLLKASDESALKATANHISVYLWVKNVDAIYEHYRPRLEALSEDRVRALFNQPYGMREFHVKDPDGCLLFFGENITK